MRSAFFRLSALGLAVGALLAGSSLAPRTARACSCYVGPGSFFVLPQGGADAPPNTRVWLGNPTVIGTLELRDADGLDIPVTTTRIAEAGPEQGETVVLTPARLLTPGLRYEVVARASDGSTTQVSGAFNVVGNPDDQAPPVPEIIDVEPQVNEDEGNSCGKFRALNVTAQGEGLAVVRLAPPQSAEALESDAPAGTVNRVLLDNGRGFVFGYGGPCVAWPGSSDVIAVQLASFDLAGNFSGWGEAQSLRRPQFSDDFLGCAVRTPGERPHAGNVAAVVAVLLPVALRRRSRPR